jgi:hypothetical protein
MIAHFMHNAISITAQHSEGLKPWLVSLGFPGTADAPMPGAWVAAAGALVTIGVLICLVSPRRDPTAEFLPEQIQTSAVFTKV